MRDACRQIMATADEYNCYAFVGQCFQHFLQVLARRHVQSNKRLIQHQQTGLLLQGFYQLHLFVFTIGKMRKWLIQYMCYRQLVYMLQCCAVYIVEPFSGTKCIIGIATVVALLIIHITGIGFVFKMVHLRHKHRMLLCS